MAATLASAYPDLYAAVGVHSGLPHAAASDLVSALTAMKQGPKARGVRVPDSRVQSVATIAFHGDRDNVVHPGNGEEVIAQARRTSAAHVPADAASTVRVDRGTAPGGRAYTRSVHLDASGRIDAEHWVVHGAGHAWAGGSSAGSYTDPQGPDASKEMLRFFLEHPKRQ
jgi:poly(3-hydroxybutyrate) depolymerase